MSKPKPDAGISARLTEARQSSGLTRQQLAEQAGTTADVVGRWERCEANPNSSTLMQVADVLGVRYLWLHEGVGDMKAGSFHLNCPHCGGELALQVGITSKHPS